MKLKRCVTCGQLFVPPSGSARYCPGRCRYEAVRAQDKASKRRRRGKKKSDEQLEREMETYWARVACDTPRQVTSPIATLSRWA